MTDAERLRSWAQMLNDWHSEDEESCESAILLRRTAKRLEQLEADAKRLAAIDEVLREQNCTPDDYVRCDAVRAIELLAARDLLPKAEVAADE